MANINAYGAISGLSSVSTTGAKDVKTSNGLGMEDFMTLLTYQLTNQDPMNPMQDTDFIAQMAQFTSLQMAQSQAEIAYTNQGINLVGKNVVVSFLDATGAAKTDTGLVEACRFLDGETRLIVNGKEYGLSNVMEVVTAKDSIPEEPEVPKEPEAPAEI